MVIYKPCGFQFNILYHATVRLPLLNIIQASTILEAPWSWSKHTHKETHTFFKPVLCEPPVSVYLYGWAPGCDQQTQSWTASHPLRCPCFPAIHSSITSKAPSAGGFYTNTCSLIYNSQWACRHPRLGITHVDNSSGAYILGSKGQCLNLEV